MYAVVQADRGQTWRPRHDRRGVDLHRKESQQKSENNIYLSVITVHDNFLTSRLLISILSVDCLVQSISFLLHISLCAFLRQGLVASVDEKSTHAFSVPCS